MFSIPTGSGTRSSDTLDPVYFARTLANAGMKAAANPVGVGTALLKAAAGAMKVGAATMAKAAKTADPDAPAPIPPQPKDHRWSSQAWQDNPYFFGLQQTYLLTKNLADDLIDAANLDEAEHRKAKFAASFAFDTLAPTNMLLTNPDALAKAAATGGASVVKGAANMLHDLRHNDGWPSKVDDSGFEPGLNMALTPGKVVYRSDLIELMQYGAPDRADLRDADAVLPAVDQQVLHHGPGPAEEPDEWAVQHGHTCFTISYRNPDGSMRDTSFEDYLRQGPLDALRVVQEITGQEKVNTVKVCLGGTLTALAMAHGAATGDEPVHTATFLNTLTDFSDPGVLGAFTDEPTVAGLERKMADQGYLEASEMARTFDAIRATTSSSSTCEQLAAGRGSPRIRPAWPGTTTAPGCRPGCTAATCAAAISATSSPTTPSRWTTPCCILPM